MNEVVNWISYIKFGGMLQKYTQFLFSSLYLTLLPELINVSSTLIM